MDDRRAVVGVTASGEGFLTNLRFMYAIPSSRFEFELLATRGERIALCRTPFAGEADGGGTFEWPMLTLFEFDDGGRITRFVVFDWDAVDAAFAELDARYAAGEAALYPRVSATMQAFTRAFAARDWDALGALFDAGLVVHDHRRLGWETLRGPGAYLATLRALVELAPDARLRLDHVRGTAHGLLWVASWIGTREGGPFETPWITVSEHDVLGRVVRFDQYDVEQLGAALARFAALRPDPLRIPENAAVRASQRVRHCVEKEDWPALRALGTADFLFADRRRLALVNGGMDLYIQNLQVVRSYPRLRPERELLGTCGDRVAIFRLLYSGGAAGSAFEGEFLVMTEVDAEGRPRAVIHFDVEDRAAVFEEAEVRFVAGQAAAGGQAPVLALHRAFARRDWEAARACLADDFELRDHRLLGLGVIGRDAWIEWVRAEADLTREVHSESSWILAWSRSGQVRAGRVRGTLRDGGEFEHLFVSVSCTDGEHIRRHETFEIGDAERALARFAELSAASR